MSITQNIAVLHPAEDAGENSELEQAVETKFREILGGSLTMIRRAKGMSQFELAKESKIPFKLVRAMEEGQALIELSQLHYLADALEIDPNDLLGFAQSAARALVLTKKKS